MRSVDDVRLRSADDRRVDREGELQVHRVLGDDLARRRDDVAVGVDVGAHEVVLVRVDRRRTATTLPSRRGELRLAGLPRPVAEVISQRTSCTGLIAAPLPRRRWPLDSPPSPCVCDRGDGWACRPSRSSRTAGRRASMPGPPRGRGAGRQVLRVPGVVDQAHHELRRRRRRRPGRRRCRAACRSRAGSDARGGDAVHARRCRRDRRQVDLPGSCRRAG